MRVTYYPNTRASWRPHGLTLSWGALAADLGRFRMHAGEKSCGNAKEHQGDAPCRLHHAPLWSPVALREPRRLAVNVATVCALVLDYDDDAALPLSEALARWDGYERCGYTTWSHRPDAPRCRVVLPLARPIPGAWWGQIYRSMLEGTGQDADPKCVDPSRAYYVPCVGFGGPHEHAREPGELLDLYDEAEDLERERAAADRARAEERRQQAIQARRALRDEDDTARAMRRLLGSDASARLRLAERVGAKLHRSDGGAEIARFAPCPSCGRYDVWWTIPRGWARCNHVNSCGWQGHLYDYARVQG